MNAFIIIERYIYMNNKIENPTRNMHAFKGNEAFMFRCLWIIRLLFDSQFTGICRLYAIAFNTHEVFAFLTSKWDNFNIATVTTRISNVFEAFNLKHLKMLHFSWDFSKSADFNQFFFCFAKSFICEKTPATSIYAWHNMCFQPNHITNKVKFRTSFLMCRN